MASSPYKDSDVRIVFSVSAGNGLSWNSSTNKFDMSSMLGNLADVIDYKILCINFDSGNYSGGGILDHQYRDISTGLVVGGGTLICLFVQE